LARSNEQLSGELQLQSSIFIVIVFGVDFSRVLWRRFAVSMMMTSVAAAAVMLMIRVVRIGAGL